MFEKSYAKSVICAGILFLIAAAFVGYLFISLPDNHQSADALIVAFFLSLVIGIIFILFGAAIIHDEKRKLSASKNSG